MTIYEIKRRTQKTSPYFFSRKTMLAFGQTLKDFKVHKQPNGKYLISAETHDRWSVKHTTKELFNPETNKLEGVI